MSISNYAENKILGHLTGESSWTAPTTLYIQLHTADPGEDGTTAVAGESSRKSISWSAASGGSISASGTISWVNVSTEETYTHWSIWDASTAGNCLWVGALSSSASMLVGESFQITSLTLSLD